MCGAVAADLLPGDPVWLGLIGPPSSAKTELLNALGQLDFVQSEGTITVAGLLSGTPKRDTERGSKGGLLREIGAFGILSLKDFGSVLTMRPEAKAELLGALREIYDGHWSRTIGTGGGRRLYWAGKLGLIFGCTEVYDQHYSVIGTMGDRFLLCRFKPEDPDNQFDMALRHSGREGERMRAELRQAVVALFKAPRHEPRPLAADEHAQLKRTVSLAVKLRGGVERDWRSREVEQVYTPEGPGRLALSLERLLAGLDTLGVERETALLVVDYVAISSCPRMRRRAYEILTEPLSTRAVAERLRLPPNTARRALEELVAQGVAIRGKNSSSDMWWRA
jgi:hypothetical protein